MWSHTVMQLPEGSVEGKQELPNTQHSACSQTIKKLALKCNTLACS